MMRRSPPICSTAPRRPGAPDRRIHPPLRTRRPGLRSRARRARRLPLLSLLATLLALFAGSPLRAQTEEGTVVYLVRHAEKAEVPADDPPLTAEGKARAQALVHALADAGITAIHSTDTERTRATAEPTARALGLEVRLYDGTDLETIAQRLRTRPGRHLVVGHSNTTPELVGLLGGDPGPPIAEAWEHDRLYVVILDAGEGPGRTLLLRFGAPSAAR